MGLAPSRNGESIGKLAVAKVPVPILFGTILARGNPRRLSAISSGYVATNKRPPRTTLIPDACRREIQDRWLRW
jgi:hypothetical protein